MSKTDFENVIKEINDGILFAESRGYGGLAATMKKSLALLKEQENKKLIDADKLREKLGFALHCEDCKHDSWKCGYETIYSLYDFCTTIDIAIEELMQEGR